jgi:hypothetical protein
MIATETHLNEHRGTFYHSTCILQERLVGVNLVRLHLREKVSFFEQSISDLVKFYQRYTSTGKVYLHWKNQIDQKCKQKVIYTDRAFNNIVSSQIRLVKQNVPVVTANDVCPCCSCKAPIVLYFTHCLGSIPSMCFSRLREGIKMQDSLRKELIKIESFEDLKEVYGFLKTISAKLSSKQALRFNLLDTVEFTYQGKTVRGTVTKVNQKTIKVLAADKKRWSVSPNLLRII